MWFSAIFSTGFSTLSVEEVFLRWSELT